jgi:predicted Rdx family selenoprotein
LAAEIENVLSEDSVLVKSSGGVFEIHDRDELIFSKKETNRFPHDGEVITIVGLVAQGKSLSDAQTAASANIPQPPSFMEWLSNHFRKRR